MSQLRCGRRSGRGTSCVGPFEALCFAMIRKRHDSFTHTHTHTIYYARQTWSERATITNLLVHFLKWILISKAHTYDSFNNVQVQRSGFNHSKFQEWGCLALTLVLIPGSARYLPKYPQRRN